METLKTREDNYTDSSDPITAKGSELTYTEGDANYIGLLQRIHAAMPVGVMIPYLGTSAPTGFLLANGDSIGDASSLATRKSANYKELFKLLWNACINNDAALSAFDASSVAIDFSDPGVADADTAWAGHYIIHLPDMTGKIPVGVNSSGTYGESIYKSGGSEETDLSHSHTNNLATGAAGTHSHSVSGNTGSGGAHNHTIASLTLNSAGDHTHSVADTGHGHTTAITTVKVEEALAGENAVVVPDGTTELPTSEDSAAIEESTTGAHTHTLSAGATSSDGAHTHSVAITSSTELNHTHTITGGVQSQSLAATAIQPYFTVNYIVKYTWAS